jgi:hypothetical protein
MKTEADAANDRVDAAHRTDYFGRQLRRLRETYVERTGRGSSSAPMLRTRVSALALIQCLQQAGYSISSGAFSEIENGLSIPRDAPEFLAAVSTCLQLTDDEQTDLRERLIYDVAYARLGDLIAPFLQPKPAWQK